jgi:hypothetical protein
MCLFTQNSLFTSLSGNEGRNEGQKGGKKREKEAVMYNQSPLIKNIMCG